MRFQDLHETRFFGGLLAAEVGSRERTHCLSRGAEWTIVATKERCIVSNYLASDVSIPPANETGLIDWSCRNSGTWGYRPTTHMEKPFSCGKWWKASKFDNTSYSTTEKKLSLQNTFYDISFEVPRNRKLLVSRSWVKVNRSRRSTGEIWYSL